jgi:DNA polymerase-3 subunit alpha
LVKKAASLGLTSLALTDYSLCAGFYKFQQACIKEGIKPILGLETYIVPDMNARDKSEKRSNVLLIAKNEEGYKNLLDISSEAYITGFYRKPRIDFDYLKDHSEGLIVSTANLSGQIPTAVQLNEMEAAKALISQYKEVFGDDFYIEIMSHSYPDKPAIEELERTTMDTLYSLSKEMGVKAFCSNDVRYCHKSQAKSHDILTCIQNLEVEKNQDRFRIASEDFYMKSEAEMRSLFPGKEDLFTTISEIVDKVEPNLVKSGNYTPNVELPEGYTAERFLKSLIVDGLKELGFHENKEYMDRIEYEFKVFEACGYVKYFLVLWDFVNYAKQQGIYLGPGRGSAAGSLSLYCLGVTKIDPIVHDLLFERFLSVETKHDIDFDMFGLEDCDFNKEHHMNAKKLLAECEEHAEFDMDKFVSEGKRMKALGLLGKFFSMAEVSSKGGDKNEANSWIAYYCRMTDVKPSGPFKSKEVMISTRVSPPDVDLDFDYYKREEIYRYITEKHGAENTSLIGTYNTLKARQTLRSVAKVLDIGNDWDSNKDVKDKSQHKKRTLDLADMIAKLVPKTVDITLDEAAKQVPELKQLMEKYGLGICQNIEGRVSYAGIHAAGILVSSKRIREITPLRVSNKTVCSQFDKEEVEELGLLKYDILALRTLSVIDNTIKLIKETRGEVIDVDKLTPNDPKVFALLNKGFTKGIFQMEGDGITSVLKSIRVDGFNDMAAVNAIYRPGPLNAKVDKLYADIKHGRKEAQVPHESMRKVLEETYGLIVYQEQIMRLSKEMAGFTSSEADKLRKAIGKKKLDQLKKLREKFVAGCIANGIPGEVGEEVWRQIEYFGGYGFNKSHSVAYAFIAYQTAFLKRYYTLEFMCCLLSSEVGDTDKLKMYMNDCRSLKIKLLSCDINKSGLSFKVDNDGLRAPLTMIKGIGPRAVDDIVSNQPFNSFKNFVWKVDGRAVTSGVVEKLIGWGCFNSFSKDKDALMSKYESIKRELKNRKVNDEQFASINLFDINV